MLFNGDGRFQMEPMGDPRAVASRQLAKHFELKLKGRLGLDAKGAKDMRVLNRIVRVYDTGLTYEADPRHVGLLAQSPNLQDCKADATPGVEKPFEEAIMDVIINDDMTTSTLATAVTKIQRVSFCKKVVGISVPAYNSHHPVHPREMVLGKQGQYRMLSHQDDPFTGLGMDKQALRRSEIKKAIADTDTASRKRSVVRSVPINGSPWEIPNSIISAKAGYTFVKKRLGAKAVKAAERLSDCGECLHEPESTTYRQLAARANYLAVDSPDCGYATKE